MKTCPHCKIEIIGEANCCTLCQNDLNGEGGQRLWPSPVKLRKKSILYKIQLFIMLTVVVICMGLDFLFELNKEKHWSFMVLAFVVLFQFFLRSAMREHKYILRHITHILIDVTIYLLLWGFYIGGLKIFVDLVIPIMLGVAMFINFIFSFIDKKGNAMVYLLGSVFCCVLPNIYFITMKGKAPITWSVVLMASSIAFIAAVVFNGKKVILEIQKRISV